MSLEENAKKLADLLRSSTRACIGNETDVAVLFSGGLDSAVLAVIARKFCDVKLYVCGTAGSHDVLWATESAYMLDLPLTHIEVTRERVLESLSRLVNTHGLDEPGWATTLIAFEIVSSGVEEGLMLSGQGADELFGGYVKYSRISPSDAERMMSGDLKELMQSESTMYDKVAETKGKVLGLPYLSADMVRFSESIPIDQKLGEEANKTVLREAAITLGVPGSMAWKQKKAMQYGSSVSKLLRSHLKGKGTDLEGFMRSLGRLP